MTATDSAGLSYRRLMLLSAGTGALGGLCAAAYYFVLQGGLAGVWDTLAPWVWSALPAAANGQLWIITAIGGLGVGLCVRTLGTPGEISAVVNNLHIEHGRIDWRQNPSMIATSLISISFGGSGGPEAPLVQIIGSMGSWIGDRLGLAAGQARMLTLSGMAAALGAFFGAPLGGALFALEIPHRRGLEYYEAIIPAVVAASASCFVFRSIVGYETPLYEFPGPAEVSTVTMISAAGLGVLGAAVGSAFIAAFRAMGRVAARAAGAPILRALVGGIAIGVIAQSMPSGFPASTLFWGEYQVRDIIAAGATLVGDYGLGSSIALLCGLAALKALAIGFTLNSGFRGGFIFPLFFLGAAVGLAVSLATQGTIPVAEAMLCTMAAVNVAVTKTPVSTAVILTTLSGLPLLPVIATSCVVSFLVTSRVNLIASQRSRAAT